MRRGPLSKLIARRARALEQELLESDGEPSPDTLTALARLFEAERLLQQSRRRIGLWPVAAMVLFTFALVSLLMVLRVDDTRVTLRLHIEEFTFALAGDQIVSDFISLTSLSVAGLDRIDLPSVLANALPRDIGERDGPLDFEARAQPASGDEEAGEIALAPISLPKETRVILAATPGSRAISLSILEHPVAIKAVLHGPVLLAASGQPFRPQNLAIPRSVTMTSSGSPVALALLPSATANLPFPVLATRGISFDRVDRFTVDGDLRTLAVSTIRSGTLCFDDIPDRCIMLGRGYQLSFRDLDGVLIPEAIGEKGLEIRYHGLVSDLEGGPGLVKQDLMPSLLGWLRAQQEVALLWASVVYALGLLFGVLRWVGLRT